MYMKTGLMEKSGRKTELDLQKKTVCFLPVPEFLKWGIPQNGNFQIEGSLKMEISKTRDPSQHTSTAYQSTL